LVRACCQVEHPHTLVLTSCRQHISTTHGPVKHRYTQYPTYPYNTWSGKHRYTQYPTYLYNTWSGKTHNTYTRIQTIAHLILKFILCVNECSQCCTFNICYCVMCIKEGMKLCLMSRRHNVGHSATSFLKLNSPLLGEKSKSNILLTVTVLNSQVHIRHMYNTITTI
jgi:hypothetical protein